MRWFHILARVQGVTALVVVLCIMMAAIMLFNDQLTLVFLPLFVYVQKMVRRFLVLLTYIRNIHINLFFVMKSTVCLLTLSLFCLDGIH